MAEPVYVYEVLNSFEDDAFSYGLFSSHEKAVEWMFRQQANGHEAAENFCIERRVLDDVKDINK